MSVLSIRRITFGGAGVWMLWQAAQSYAHVGLVSDTTFPAALGLVMMVLAITAKSG
jgi:hypothetical protein